MATKYMMATIDVLIEIEDDGQDEGRAADTFSETMRPLLKEFGSDTGFIDWRYRFDEKGYHYAEEHTGEGFEYVEAREPVVATTPAELAEVLNIPVEALTTLPIIAPIEQCAAIADRVAANNKCGSTPEAHACYVVATEIAKYIREIQPQTSEPKDALWALAQKFIADQRIHCAETIAQTDRVIENAYEFIDGVCKIVGFLKDPDDEEDED